MKPVRLRLLGLVAGVLLMSTTSRADDRTASPALSRSSGSLDVGLGVGLGAMHFTTGPIAADVAGEVDVHIGALVTPRLAVLVELQDDAQPHFSSCGPGDITWAQWGVMAAGQLRIAPRLWVEGGLGVAHWTGEFDAQCQMRTQLTGAAIMGAIGYGLYSTRQLALDVRFRLIDGAYWGGIDDQITSGTIGLGVSVY